MEKYLTASDVRREFSVPAEWLGIPEGHNVVVWAVDEEDVNWTFHCSGTGRRYFQSKEWLQFVRHKRLTAGDRIVIGREEHPFLGPRYRIRAERG